MGGGPAGAAAAITLARAGATPLLFERSTEPQDALCGGFLSWTTLARLAALGIDAEALGAHPITRVRLIAGGRRREAALPYASAGLSRRTLDAALLTRAAAAGVAIERGVKARNHGDGLLHIEGGETLRPRALILATGKHDLRGLPRPHSESDSVGLRFRFVASPALSAAIGETIELHLFDHGYAGLLLQEDGFANLCMAFRRSRLSEAEGRPERLIADLASEAPLLGERLAGAALGRAQAIAGVPYGWRARATTPGIYRIGDQAAAIPSLAGEGIGLALAGGRAAAAAVLRGEAAEAFQPRLAAAVARPVRTASILWRIAERPRLARAALTLLPAALLPPLARATRLTVDAAPITAPAWSPLRQVAADRSVERDRVDSASLEFDPEKDV